MKYIDLHLHSHYSDGVYSPRDLVKKAKKQGFGVIAITDHQAIDGIEEASEFGKRYKIKVIPGVELNDAIFRGYKFHLLGYGLDWGNKALNDVLKKMQKQRAEGAKKCLKELQCQGFILEEKRVFKTVSKGIGLDWIINFLRKGKNWQKIKRDFKLKRGQILTLPEIFKRYFIKGEKQIFPAAEISLIEGIKVIKKAGGIPVLAHPGEQLFWRDDWIFLHLKKLGIQGIEAISPHHNWANIEHYQKIARELNLLITAGSDYHGDLPGEWKFPLDSIFDYFKTPLSSLDKKTRKILKI